MSGNGERGKSFPAFPPASCQKSAPDAMCRRGADLIGEDGNQGGDLSVSWDIQNKETLFW